MKIKRRSKQARKGPCGEETTMKIKTKIKAGPEGPQW
jgi:hypothetical protein